MKFFVVTRDLPHPEGSGVGRETFAWAESLRALGHQVQARVWRPPDDRLEPPDWCNVSSFDDQLCSSWQARLNSLIRPRRELAAFGWEPPKGTILVATDVRSAYAILPFGSPVVTVQNRAVADILACHRLQLYYVQESRAERDAARRAHTVITYSERVARSLPGNVTVVPFAYPLPLEPVDPIEHPVAYLMADWGWEPNKMALRSLLNLWPQVTQAVPGARLLLAGNMPPDVVVGAVPGVEVLGKVRDSIDVLAQASVLAFPCPGSTGPKTKVFEALAWGLPVVTTRAGAEGITLTAGEGLTVAGKRAFASKLIELLKNPERRAILGRLARGAVLTRHSPVAAARARIAVCEKIVI